MRNKTRAKAIYESVKYALTTSFSGRWVCAAQHKTWGYDITKKEFESCACRMGVPVN